MTVYHSNLGLPAAAHLAPIQPAQAAPWVKPAMTDPLHLRSLETSPWPHTQEQPQLCQVTARPVPGYFGKEAFPFVIRACMEKFVILI